MKPEEQNAAIAEWMGWERADGMNPWTDEMCHWLRPDGVGVKSCPNYLNDLNAMHAAELKLLADNHGRVAFDNTLMRVCGSHQACVSATAAQRAEALLETIGKGEEKK